jgi:hypothetical protein
MVFRESDGHAWTAQSRLTKESPVPGLSMALDWVAPVIERYARSTEGSIEMASFAKNALVDVLTLWLPTEFVGRLRYNSDLGLYTPADVDSYLTFRYDDWRTPVAEWTLTDDRAVRNQAPDALVDEIEGRFHPDTPGWYQDTEESTYATQGN